MGLLVLSQGAGAPCCGLLNLSQASIAQVDCLKAASTERLQIVEITSS